MLKKKFYEQIENISYHRKEIENKRIEHNNLKVLKFKMFCENEKKEVEYSQNRINLLARMSRLK